MINISVVVIGGNDCMVTTYKNICKDYKCKAKVFTHMGANFQSVIGNPDLLIVFTGTCSHKMLSVAKEKARKQNFLIENVHSSSASALKKTLEKYVKR